MTAPPYRDLPLDALTQVDDGQLVLTRGHHHHTPQGVVLRAQDTRIAVLGEPFDGWVPESGDQVELWGQVWAGPSLRLLVHGMRPSGHSVPAPRPQPRPAANEALTLIARVTVSGPDVVATTPDRGSFLLLSPPAPGYHRLSGRVVGTWPPTFRLEQAESLAHVLRPPP